MTDQNTGAPGRIQGQTGDAALEAAIKAALAERGERDTLSSLLGDALRGQSQPLALLTIVAQVAMLAVAVASAVAFFSASATQRQIMFATLFLFAMHAAGMIKSWFWMQIHRNRVIREVKRLELQVARLAEARG